MKVARPLVAGWLIGFSLLALASGGSLATLTKLEEYSGETPSAVPHEPRETYTGPEANATRHQADTDLSRLVAARAALKRRAARRSPDDPPPLPC